MLAVLDIRAVAQALSGDVIGRDQVLAPGPGHSSRDRSLAVWIDHHAPDGFRAHSHAGDDWRVCRELVRAALRLPEPWYGTFRRSAPCFAGNEQRTELASKIWNEARPVDDTLAAAYLRARGIDITPWPEPLRYHPACPKGRTRQPALVAALVGIETKACVAIARRFLTPAGAADGKPFTLGPSRRAVVKLTPDEDVTHALGLAEGIETALSLLAIGWAPLWACGGTATLAGFPLLPGIESLTVFADHDENGAGLAAAMACAERYLTANREVRIIRPCAVEADFNDVLRP